MQYVTSVTRLGDLLHFGQLFKACGINYFAQITHILGNFVKLLKSFILLVKSFLANFYRHLAIFYWSPCLRPLTHSLTPPFKWHKNGEKIAGAGLCHCDWNSCCLLLLMKMQKFQLNVALPNNSLVGHCHSSVDLSVLSILPPWVLLPNMPSTLYHF